VSTFIAAGDIGQGWLRAYKALSDAPQRQLINMAVDIAEPLTEDLGIRAALERHLALLRDRSTRGSWQSVHTVANTIFPISLYNPGRPDSATQFFANAQMADRARHGRYRSWGTYIGRLIDYQLPGGTRINQLESMLRVLQGERNWADLYEAPLTYPGETSADPYLGGLDAPIIGPGDRRRRGGPCLAHISITALDGRLHLTAQYRRHSYIARAYGNFLGLARLLNFLAEESCYQVGGMLVVGTHAEIEESAGSSDLLISAESAQGNMHSIEVANRPLGASWKDLELPAKAPGVIR
jgi:hypothetical protein